MTDAETFITRSAPQSEEGTVTVAIRSRKTHALIGQLSHWISISWTERWRSFGTGKFSALAESFTRDELNQLLSGDGEIEVRRQWRNGNGVEHEDVMIGPVTRISYQDGTFIQYTRDLAAVVNEVAVLGDGAAGTRNVTRRFDAASQTSFGLREIPLDQPDLAVAAEREDFGDSYIAERVTGSLQTRAGGSRGRLGVVVTVFFRDLLGYLADRYVDTDGVATVDPTSGTPTEASTIIESFIDSELVNPTIARRDQDFNLVVTVPSPAIGNLVQYPVRWRRLSDVIQTLCVMGGDLGITYTLDDSTSPATVRYEVKEKNARPDVIISEPMADQQWDIRSGDEVTVEGFLLADSVVPDIPAQSVLCVGRKINLRAGKPVVITPELGTEDRELTTILRSIDTRNAGSQFR